MKKKIIKIIIGILLLFVAYNLMLPWRAFHFEHFEYQVANVFPFSWKVISIMSRVLIGILLILGFYLILENKKVKWLKYLSVLSISIPFIINPVFPENWKNESPITSESLSFETDSFKADDTVLLAYFTNGCRFCKEAALKLDVAMKKNENFTKVLVVSNSKDLEAYFSENNFDYKIEVISMQTLVQTARGAFPHFQLVKDKKVVQDWNNSQFNYEVLDILSEKN